MNSCLQLKVHFLNKPKQRITLDSPNLGILLLDLLKWYGIEMNYS
jgi:DNA polymerase sigma